MATIRDYIQATAQKMRELGEPEGVEATLDTRATTYGKFATQASLSQLLKAVLDQGTSHLLPYQRESLDMIVHKIARILNGDPNYIDSWHDIAGYATLVELELKGEGK